MKIPIKIVLGIMLSLLSVLAIAEATAVITGNEGPQADFLIYLISAWDELSLLSRILAVFWLLVPVFSLIVALTPTPRDDVWWGKYIYPALEWLALNVLNAKHKPDKTPQNQTNPDDQEWL